MKVLHNLPLVDYTSLHTGGPAEKLIVTDGTDDLSNILKGLNEPIWVLGYGTNVLVSDKGLGGTVILNHAGGIRVSGTKIEADSGAVWDDLVKLAILHNLWGLEFTSGIPGGVGAAVAGSIAAYGHRISDRLVSAEVLDTQTKQIETWEAHRFNFGYRRSDLQKPENSRYVILKAVFELSQEPTGNLEYDSALKAASDLGIRPNSLKNRRKIILEARRRAGSLLNDVKKGPWTAGSFFKNPHVDESQIEAIIAHEEHSVGRDQIVRQNVIHGGEKTRVSAAHVLLAAGFKRGQTWDHVRLDPEHVLKLENIGGAAAQEIYNVVQHIIQTVQGKLGIDLEPEVRFLGEFS